MVGWGFSRLLVEPEPLHAGPAHPLATGRCRPSEMHCPRVLPRAMAPPPCTPPALTPRPGTLVSPREEEGAL